MSERTQIAEKAALLRHRTRIVVKVGSAVIADRGGLDPAALARIAQEVAAARQQGWTVTLVSSGAIAAGRNALGGDAPRSIPERQAAAAIGQIALMAEYQRAFAQHGIRVAQILLDAHDIEYRRRYLNAEHALATLHAHGILPIVNENDTVAIDELKFGDNDNLSALVANLVGADLLVILSNVKGLHTADPTRYADAERIAVLTRVDDDALGRAGADASQLGTGGMHSKLAAASKAAAAGIATVIADGRTPGILTQVLDASQDVGTLVLPQADRLARRKHWIAFALKPRGALRCDAGATRAVRFDGRSLLPSGVVSISGRFDAGDCVSLLDSGGAEFARGLSSYASSEAKRICGKRSNEVEAILGYKMGDEIVHRDDLALTSPGASDDEGDGNAPTEPAPDTEPSGVKETEEAE